MRTAGQIGYGSQIDWGIYRPKRKKGIIADAVCVCIKVYAAIFSMLLIAHVLW